MNNDVSSWRRGGGFRHPYWCRHILPVAVSVLDMKLKYFLSHTVTLTSNRIRFKSD